MVRYRFAVCGGSQMKSLFLAAGLIAATAGMAQAADPPMMEPVLVEEMFDWTGLSVGLHAGAGWGTKDWTFTAVYIGGVAVPLVPAPTTSHTVSGFLGGGQVGYDWQTGKLVLGVQLDGSIANINGSSVCPNPAANCVSEINFLGSATVRAGVAVNRGLFYVRGGVAVVNEDFFVRFPAAPANDEQAANITQAGFTVGAGAEVAVTDHFSIFGEYNYNNFGTRGVTFSRITGGALVEDANIRQSVHTVKVGFNYRP